MVSLERVTTMTPLNTMQKAVLEVYGHGDYKHIIDMPDAEARQAILNAGDTLLRYIMIDISDSECVEGAEDAVARLEHAVNDLHVSINAIVQKCYQGETHPAD